MRRSDIEKAKKICKDELHMRDIVFKKDWVKRRNKMKEMQYVIDTLDKCAKLLPEEQKLLFPE